jgi:autotransporter strand-loop-strand O-heptosyltransferase
MKKYWLSEFASYYGKQWLYPDGWTEIIDYLHSLGFEVVSVSTEKTNIQDVISFNGRPLEETVCNIQHSEFFIGMSSGLSWLAWGLGLPVVLISGMTKPYSEMQADCYRVINKSVCHGCFHDPEIDFAKVDERTCPKNKFYECSRMITPGMVKEAISKLLFCKGEKSHV